MEFWQPQILPEVGPSGSGGPAHRAPIAAAPAWWSEEVMEPEALPEIARLMEVAAFVEGLEAGTEELPGAPLATGRRAAPPRSASGLVRPAVPAVAIVPDAGLPPAGPADAVVAPAVPAMDLAIVPPPPPPVAERPAHPRTVDGLDLEIQHSVAPHASPQAETRTSCIVHPLAFVVACPRQCE